MALLCHGLKNPLTILGFFGGVLAAGIVLGLFIGYERWGSTAALVLMVEKELAASQAHIKTLEKKMAVLEGKLGMANVGNLSWEQAAGATERAGLR